MLGLFSVKISDFNTAWLWRCFVVNFADFGEIWGGPLACMDRSLVEYVRGIK
jgi:hypothetical protein